MMSRKLPVFPNLDYLRKQAKALLRELQQRNPDATLAEAQHAVARAYGFASWAKLKAHVESLPPPADAVPAEAAGSQGPDGRDTTAGTIGIPIPDGSPFARYTEKARLVI